MRDDFSILVVDDELPLLEIVSEFLGSVGYTVYTASTQKEALAISREQAGRVKLVIMDVMMPDELGPVIVDKLLQDNPALRVLYLSGMAPNEDMFSGISKLPMAMLRKPCAMDDLERTVAKLMNFRDVVDANAIPPPNSEPDSHNVGA